MSNRARQDRVWAKLDEEVQALRRAKPQLTKEQATREILNADPSWSEDFDRATRADAKAQEAELLAANRGE